MSNRLEIADVISEIDNLLENRELHKSYPNRAVRFADQLKKLEVWFLSKVFIDNFKFLHTVVDLCQNGPHTDVRKFMAFARYSFRELGPERFEERINKSSLASWGKWLIIGFFRIGEIDRVLVDKISDPVDVEYKGINTSGFFSGKPVSEVAARI